MFNKSFNLTTAIADMFPTVRRAVLFSLVGSVNAQIVGAADKLAVRLEDEGYDLRDLEPKDFVVLMKGVDDIDQLDEIRKLTALAHEWRDMLRHVSNTDPEVLESEQPGSIHSTISMMTGAQRMRPAAVGARAALKAIGVEVTAQDVEAARVRQFANDQARADQRAKRRGAIEYIVEHVFDYLDTSDTEWYTQINAEHKERLCTKLFAALNTAVTTATQNVLIGVRSDNALGLNDITLIRDTATRLMAEAFPPTKARKPKAPSAKRAPAPAPAPAKVTRVSEVVDGVLTTKEVVQDSEPVVHAPRSNKAVARVIAEKTS